MIQQMINENASKAADQANDDLGVAIQCICQIFGTALFIHDLDQTGLMLHAKYGSLQLTIHHDTVGDNADRIKNHMILGIVQGCQTVGKPCNGIGLAAARGVLDQIVLLRMILHHIRHQLTHRIELVISGENQGFLRFPLAGVRILLCFLL